MKIITKQSKTYKIIISLLIVITLFNVVSPTISRASSIGGVLLDPIEAFLVALGDAVMNIINKVDSGNR